MRYPTEKEVARIKTMYPKGTRVQLNYTNDPYTRLKPGAMGSVMFVDDIGTVHISWDCGSGLGLIPGVDSFRRVDNEV